MKAFELTEANKEAAVADELARSRSNLASARLLATAGNHAESVSLAYYAGFHAIRAMLVSKGLEPKSHQGLVHLFNVTFILPRLVDARLLALLGRAQQERIRADCDASAIFTSAAALAEISTAEELLRTAESMLIAK